jgi:hypothetical protein
LISHKGIVAVTHQALDTGAHFRCYQEKVLLGDLRFLRDQRRSFQKITSSKILDIHLSNGDSRFRGLLVRDRLAGHLFLSPVPHQQMTIRASYPITVKPDMC